MSAESDLGRVMSDVTPQQAADYELYDDEDFGDEYACTHCGGEGEIENDDPLWYVGDFIPCHACGGTGNRRDQRIF